MGVTMLRVVPEGGVRFSHGAAGPVTTAVQDSAPPAPVLVRFNVTGDGAGAPAVPVKATGF